MKKRSLISIVIVCVFLSSGIAFAGFESMPFIGQLGAVENILNSANARVVKTMEVPPDPCTPPDPCVPGPDLNGALNRLEAINSQLGSVGDMIFSIINEVMGFEPTPFIPAFEAVRDAAQGIDDNIKEFLSISPDDIMPEFVTALEGVQGSAQDIVRTADGYINFECLGTSALCDFLTKVDCENQAGCAWIYHIGGDGIPGYFICNGTATTCSDLFDPESCNAQIGCNYEE